MHLVNVFPPTAQVGEIKACEASSSNNKQCRCVYACICSVVLVCSVTALNMQPRSLATTSQVASSSTWKIYKVGHENTCTQFERDGSRVGAFVDRHAFSQVLRMWGFGERGACCPRKNEPAICAPMDVGCKPQYGPLRIGSKESSEMIRPLEQKWSYTIQPNKSRFTDELLGHKLRKCDQACSSVHVIIQHKQAS